MVVVERAARTRRTRAARATAADTVLPFLMGKRAAAVTMHDLVGMVGWRGALVLVRHAVWIRLAHAQTHGCGLTRWTRGPMWPRRRMHWVAAGWNTRTYLRREQRDTAGARTVNVMAEGGRGV